MVTTSQTILGERDFVGNAEEGKIAPLILKLSNCDISPSCALSVLRNAQPFCLLQSAGGSPALTRYSFLGLDPLAIFRYRNSRAHIRGNSQVVKYASCRTLGNPFQLLRSLTQRLAPTRVAPNVSIPFWGGAMGFLSYDVGRYIEKLPTLAEDDLLLPELCFIFPEILLVFDHVNNELYLVINKLVGSDPKRSYGEAVENLDRVCFLLGQSCSDIRVAKSLPQAKPAKTSVITSNMSQPEYEKIVERIREYICAGDVYQVNISQRLEIPYADDPALLYQCLTEVNPSPFASYLDCGDFQLVSSSPERLIALRGRIAETRPIAGTRRRGQDFIEDTELSSNLILDQKERAEHIMLVDLERNDLGRVCKFGSVEVSELMVLEKYSHVIHIVSNVKGVLRAGRDQFDLIQTMFPGGTITGCPKVRCMEIIEELEPVRRGPYTGSIGYFGFNGNMDMNIIIRTFVVKDKRAYIQVGAGIVSDSKPDREYFETLSKADALLAAVGYQKEAKEWEKLPM